MSSQARQTDRVSSEIPLLPVSTSLKRAPPPPPKPRKALPIQATSSLQRPNPDRISSKYLMNDIPLGTTRINLINSLLAPTHWHDLDAASSRKLHAHVQFTCDIADSRLDAELSVAAIEFTDTPTWLRYASLDPFGFPKKTTLGTLWRWVDKTAVDEDGQTAFMRAVCAGDLLYAETLAEFSDTDVNVQDKQGRTALHWASVKNHPDCAALCLSVPDCNVGLRDEDDRTAFDISLIIPESPVATVFYQSVIDLDSRAPDEVLLRVLTMSAEPPTGKPVFPAAAIFDSIENRNSPLIRALITRGVDLTATRDGDTALHVAAAHMENSEVVQWLLEAGSEIDVIGAGGATALHRAARSSDEDTVAVLLRWKANVVLRDSDGKTALRCAEEGGNRRIAQLLVELEGGGPVVLSEGTTNLDGSVRESGDEQTVLVPSVQVIDRPDAAGDTALHRAVKDGRLDTVLALLAQGADKEARDGFDRTALQQAAMDGHIGITVALLDAGARVNVGHVVSNTALMLACYNGHTEIVRALLANGADAQSQDWSRRTALHRAASEGHSEIVSLLLAGGRGSTSTGKLETTALQSPAFPGEPNQTAVVIYPGANIETRDAYDWTALHLAAMYGRSEVVLVLLAAGAMIEARTNAVTSMGLALECKNWDVVQILKAHGAYMSLADRLRYRRRQK